MVMSMVKRSVWGSPVEWSRPTVDQQLFGWINNQTARHDTSVARNRIDGSKVCSPLTHHSGGIRHVGIRNNSFFDIYYTSLICSILTFILPISIWRIPVFQNRVVCQWYSQRYCIFLPRDGGTRSIIAQFSFGTDEGLWRWEYNVYAQRWTLTDEFSFILFTKQMDFHLR